MRFGFHRGQSGRRIGGGGCPEEGNVSYGFYEDAMEPNAFIFVERWRDQEAVSLHFAKPYSGAFVKGVRAIALNDPKIELHDVSGQRVLSPGR